MHYPGNAAVKSEPADLFQEDSYDDEKCFSVIESIETVEAVGGVEYDVKIEPIESKRGHCVWMSPHGHPLRPIHSIHPIHQHDNHVQHMESDQIMFNSVETVIKVEPEDIKLNQDHRYSHSSIGETNIKVEPEDFQLEEIDGSSHFSFEKTHLKDEPESAQSDEDDSSSHFSFEETHLKIEPENSQSDEDDVSSHFSFKETHLKVEPQNAQSDEDDGTSHFSFEETHLKDEPENAQSDEDDDSSHFSFEETHLKVEPENAQSDEDDGTSHSSFVVTNLKGESKDIQSDENYASTPEPTIKNERETSHENFANETIKQDNTCHICGRKFQNAHGLRIHLSKPHRTGKEEPFRCNLCPKLLKNAFALKVHKNYCHYFKCITCSEQFPNKKSLHVHRKTPNVHTRQCDKCPYIAKIPSLLKAHKLTHLKESAYQCDLCDRVFKVEKYLSRHMKAHHNTKGEIICFVCSNRFSTMALAKEHVRCCIAFVKYSNDHEGENFECEMCHETFKRTKDARQHMLSHNLSDENFKCDLCPKIFANRRYMNAHKRKVHYGKPIRFDVSLPIDKFIKQLTSEEWENYECELCNQRFMKRAYARKHIRKVHNPIPQNKPSTEHKEGIQSMGPFEELLNAFEANVTANLANAHLMDHDYTYNLSPENESSQESLNVQVKHIKKSFDLTYVHLLDHDYTPRNNLGPQNKPLKHFVNMAMQRNFKKSKFTHMQVVSAQCVVCQKIFSNPRSLAEHRKEHE